HHHDADQPLLGIDPVAGPQDATPPIRADRAERAVGAEILDQPEAEAEPEARAEWILEITCGIRRHELHGLWTEQAHAVESAAIEQKRREGGGVGGGAEETGAAREECGRARGAGAAEETEPNPAVFPGVACRHGPKRVVLGRIAGGEATELLVGHEKSGVVHLERAEDARS